MNIRVVSIGMLFLSVFIPDLVQAQSKFFSTSSRGGVEGAKQNVILTVLQNEQQRMNTCTAAGMLYGPTHPQANANGCIPGLVLQEQGHASFSGNLGIGSPAIDVNGVRLYVRDTTPNTNTVIAIDNSGVPGGYDAQLILKNSLHQWGVVAAGPADGADAAGAFGVLDQTLNGFRLIIDSTGRVGIGTASPAYKLDVNGDISVRGYAKLGTSAEACTTSTEGAIRYNGTDKQVELCNGDDWQVLGAGGSGGYTGSLVNGTHTGADCTGAGGETVEIGGGSYLCRFAGTSCAPGWAKYQNWTTATSATYPHPVCSGSRTCSGHTWANQSPNCTVVRDNYAAGINSSCGCQCENDGWSATVIQVGCY